MLRLLDTTLNLEAQYYNNDKNLEHETPVILGMAFCKCENLRKNTSIFKVNQKIETESKFQNVVFVEHEMEAVPLLQYRFSSYGKRLDLILDDSVTSMNLKIIAPVREVGVFQIQNGSLYKLGIVTYKKKSVDVPCYRIDYQRYTKRSRKVLATLLSGKSQKGLHKRSFRYGTPMYDTK